MKKYLQNMVRTVGLLLTACLLSGCAGLLERSYSVLEPYADRYWDSTAEDTLRAESYQDLVNSILLLIEQHAEEGVIRCYGEAQEYKKALAARSEVQRETMLGSYLVEKFNIDYESGANYSTLTCQITYREDAEDIESLMTISDSQSLVDLLRLAVREDHEKLTAHFVYDTPREDVINAAESLWQELCRAEMEENGTLSGEADAAEPALSGEEGVEAGAPGEDAAAAGEDGSPAAAPDEPQEEEEPGEIDPNGTDVEALEAPDEPEEDPIVYPPCPWLIRFYPDQAVAEVVEVLLLP